VLVTHDQEEALSLADRVVLMRDGRIEQTDAPREIYRHPKTAFAASFIGAANLIPVTVTDGRAAIAPGVSVAAPGVADGARILVLRQEDLALRAAPLAGEAAAPARVVTVAYHGAQCRVVAAVGEHRVTLLMPVGAADAWAQHDAMLCWRPVNANFLEP
jgi:ABC-type Fe3+/spermidine/putrescine transport system ATPase subunit